MFRLYLLVIVVIIIGCGEEKDESNSVVTNENGEITYLPFLWKKQHVESGNWLDYPTWIKGNWSFDNLVLCPVRREGSRTQYISGIHLKTGEELWSWEDWFNPESESINGIDYILKNDVLHWHNKKYQYFLDLETGSTVYKDEGDIEFANELYGIDDSYFALGFNYDSFPGLRVKSLYHGRDFSTKPELKLLPDVNLNQTLENRAADITSVVPLINMNDTLLVVAWQQVFPNWEFQSYLGLYDYTNSTWIYNNVILNEPDRKGVLYQPLKKYKNTVITNIGNNLLCYNYESGNKVWEREFENDFSFSGIEISDDILVANCENGNLYGINPSTGSIIWTGEGAGTSSKLKDRIVDGIVYFSGGSSGFFHAVDINSGNTIWKLDPYNYEENNAYWSTATVFVSEDTEGIVRIVIQNALNYYCFEAPNS